MLQSLKHAHAAALDFLIALETEIAARSSPAAEEVLQTPQVLKEVQMSRANLYLLIKKGRFPPANPRTSPQSKRVWRRADIEAWKAGRWRPGPKPPSKE